MRKDDQNVQVFRHVAENLTYDFFKIWLSEDLSMETILREKKPGGTGLISGKTDVL